MQELFSSGVMRHRRSMAGIFVGGVRPETARRASVEGEMIHRPPGEVRELPMQILCPSGVGVAVRLHSQRLSALVPVPDLLDKLADAF